MKKSDFYLSEYARIFNYRQFINSENKKVFLKRTNEGFIVFEPDIEEKYVNFYFNEKTKKFKSGDLFLAVLEATPIAWELER
tara:strand:+ start:211 stop:456 length:246 start_codon:yes stop_codon:yes gene_type:complete